MVSDSGQLPISAWITVRSAAQLSPLSSRSASLL